MLEDHHAMVMALSVGSCVYLCVCVCVCVCFGGGEEKVVVRFGPQVW